MKKLLFIFFILTSFFASAQIPVNRSPSTITAIDYRLYPVYNLRVPPFKDTTEANTKKGLDSLGSIISLRGSKYVFIRDTNSLGTHKWDTLGAGGSSGTTYTADETSLHLTGTQFGIKNTWTGQTSIVTVGNLINGSLATGFTPITDPFISSAATWNAKQTSVLTSAKIWVGNGSNVATEQAPSGDLTVNNSGVFTLANTAVTPGAYTNANITVDSKGRITAAANGVGGGGSTPFADNTPLIKNNADNTKLAQFSASGITTGTTRTYTFPDANGTLTLDANASTLTNKTIAAGSNTITGLTNSNLSGSAAISNANLANSAITINSVSTSLGGSMNVTDANLVTSNITTNNVSTSKHGFAPILPNDNTKYLDGTGNYSTPPTTAIPETQLGVLYSKNSWANLNQFTNNGAGTFSISASHISSNTASNSFTKTLDIDSLVGRNGYTDLPKWKMSIRNITGAKTANAYSGIGLRSYVGAGTFDIFLKFDQGTGADVGKISLIGGSAAVIYLHPTALSYTAGDSIILTLERNNQSFIGTAYNKTTGVSVTFSYSFTIIYPAAFSLPNNGKFAIAGSGPFTVDSIGINSNTIKNPAVMYVTDSKGMLYANEWDYITSSLLGPKFGSVVLEGGSSEAPTDAVLRVQELTSIAPKQIIVEVGIIIISFKLHV